MTTVTGNSRILIIVVLLAVLSSAQVIHAQDYAPGCSIVIPQWVRDRQQYETTYVYVPPAVELAFDEARCSTVQAPNS